MNEELIDEIAFQAGCHRHTYCDPKNPDLDGYIINRDVLDKYALLIVRECLEQVRDEVQYEYDWKLADAVTKRVLEHFGIKE